MTPTSPGRIEMPKPMCAIAASLMATALVGCGGGSDASSDLSGSVQIDGSSTVFPVAEAMAEEFQAEHRGVRVTAGLSGTGGGFQRFCAGEIDFTNASRPITEDEREACAEAGVEHATLTVGWDGLSVITNQANDFVECLTVEELRRIWEPNGAVETWSDVRPEWPTEPIRLYGPGTDSGTFDYFTETIVGESGASRPDFQASEDDNILVQGVAGDRYSLGYFGYAYFVENSDQLKLVAIDGGDGCITPSDETIADGSYAPLSRPLYMYVREEALQRPEVRAFAEYVLENAADLVPSTGYHALSAEEYAEQLEQLQETAGTAG